MHFLKIGAALFKRYPTLNIRKFDIRHCRQNIRYSIFKHSTSTMALSRIWSAFIIIALLVGSYHFVFNKGRDDIYGKMVTGTSKDDYKFVSILDSTSTAAISKEMKDYGYILQKEADKETKLILANQATNDSAIKLQSKFAGARIVSPEYLAGRKQKPMDGVIATCTGAVNICLGLIGIMALFMGFMSIAETAGGIRFLSRIVGPFFSKLFPEIPKGHPAHGHIMMNFSANMLGLDNAATPFGISSQSGTMSWWSAITRAIEIR